MITDTIYIIQEERLVEKLQNKTFEDNSGNTRCKKCGDKIEGGYCSCFNEVKDEQSK